MINAFEKTFKFLSKIDVPENLLFIFLKISVIVFLPLFILSMLVVPWISYDWQYLQKVWHSWQGFNVGMLAFLSTSIIFLYTHTKNEEQRKRELIAALAFLPSALATISNYLRDCIPTLEEAFDRTVSSEPNAKRQTLEKKPPELPQSFQAVFKECIRNAAPREGELLSKVLRKLQIQNSRLQSLYEKEICEGSKMFVNTHNIKSHFHDVLFIKALVDILYPYARGDVLSSFNVSKKEIVSALVALDISQSYQDSLTQLINDTYQD
ncbi:hypothetical protein ACV4QK_03525 [Alteromonas macleodii]|nr:hypothetical protein [Pseudoalteromonas sp.]|tara:strand:+ start:1108 stop:1905 length:798 start_codon:yes stop_codon:yes gene_type:complete